MKIAHKRKVQSKLHKRIKAKVTAPKTEVKKAAKPAKVAKPVEKKVEAVVAEAPKAAATDIALTPKQQTVFDIVCQNPEGINQKKLVLQLVKKKQKRQHGQQVA